jgi:branched-chain amino acid aminotransferase
MAEVWLNGEFIDDTEAGVSVRDAGFLHAAGVFTTVRVKDGLPVRLDAHLSRLRRSCETLFVPLVPNDAVLTEAAVGLVRRLNLRQARMRLTVTRGVADFQQAVPTALWTAAPFEPYPAPFYDNGMTVIVMNQHKLNPYDVQAGHKTLDYFSRFNALQAAARKSAAEALWFNVHNYLQSGSISNVFLVTRGVLRTPPTDEELKDQDTAASTPYPKSNVLPGVTRAAVLEAATEQGIEVQRCGLSIDDLLAADEVFLTNSLMGVMPVGRVEQHAYAAGPGPVTARLREAVG